TTLESLNYPKLPLNRVSPAPNRKVPSPIRLRSPIRTLQRTTKGSRKNKLAFWRAPPRRAAALMPGKLFTVCPLCFNWAWGPQQNAKLFLREPLVDRSHRGGCRRFYLGGANT